MCKTVGVWLGPGPAVSSPAWTLLDRMAVLHTGSPTAGVFGWRTGLIRGCWGLEPWPQFVSWVARLQLGPLEILSLWLQGFCECLCVPQGAHVCPRGMWPRFCALWGLWDALVVWVDMACCCPHPTPHPVINHNTQITFGLSWLLQALLSFWFSFLLFVYPLFCQIW